MSSLHQRQESGVSLALATTTNPSHYDYASCFSDSEVEEEDDEDIINGSMSECSAELLVMSELNFIRNKLRIHQQRVLVREEEVRMKEEEMKVREEEMAMREQLLAEAEVAIREKEEKVREMEKIMADLQSMMWEWVDKQTYQQEKSSVTPSVTKGTSSGDVVLKANNLVKENQRLRDSFGVLKRTNEAMKRQLEDVSTRRDEPEKQLTQVQGRLTNLIRIERQGQFREKSTVDRKTTSATNANVENNPVTNKSSGKMSQMLSSSFSQLELTVLVMEWLVRLHPLPLSLPKEEEEEEDGVGAVVCQVVPHLPDAIHHVTLCSTNVQRSCLEFVLLVVRMVRNTKQRQCVLSSSLRRVGEALYKPPNHQVADYCSFVGMSFSSPDMLHSPLAAGVKQRETHTLFTSQDLPTRLLSYMIALLTVTQVDCLAHVMHLLQCDLKEDAGKEMFVYHEGPEVVLPYMKANQKVLCAHTVNIYLLLSMTSAVSHMFVEWCASEKWVGLCADVFRNHQIVDTSILEKLSIILQRLSKNRVNRYLFNMFHLTNLFEELLCCRVDPDNPFLALNLRSVLMNLTSTPH